jgi:hypothetical protein
MGTGPSLATAPPAATEESGQSGAPNSAALAELEGIFKGAQKDAIELNKLTTKEGSLLQINKARPPV